MESSKPALELITICPDCKDINKLSQKMTCSIDKHGPYANNEVAKARVVGKDSFVRMTKEQIDDLKEPTLPSGILELSVYPAADIEAATRNGEKGYFLAVTLGSTAKLLYDLITSNPDKALVGEAVISGTQKMFRLTTWNNSLFLQQLVRPEEIAAAIPVGGSDYLQKLFPVYEQLFSEAVKAFDANDFAGHVRSRVAGLDGAKAESGKTVSAKDVSNATIEGLEALLAARKAAKATATKKKATSRKAA